MKQIFEQVVARGLIQLPSNAKDFLNPEIQPDIDKYYKGSGGIDAEKRTKILKLLWDAIGTEFGERGELYEINYAGNQENIRLNTMKLAINSGDADRFIVFVEEAMSDYDLYGYTNDTWINPESNLDPVIN